VKIRFLLRSVLVASAVLIPLPTAVAQDVARLEQVATLIRENKTTAAERELATFLRSNPNHPLALNLLGTIRAKQNRLPEAETLFVKAVTQQPRYSGARMNLAFLYLQKRQPAHARTDQHGSHGRPG
jgi:predicted Zn-dependent protease